MGWVRARTTGSAMVALLLVAACGPSPAAPVASKQEIVIVQPNDADTLDPQMATLRETQNITSKISETLFKIGWSDKGVPSIEPLLATSYKMTGPTTWRFTLRENVTFSNGEPFDAAAVVFSFKRMTDPKTPLAGATRYSFVDRVEAVDEHTVDLVTKTPAPGLLYSLPTYFYMVPPKYTQEVGREQTALKPIGTGPFKLAEWVKDDHVTLEANPGYWGGRPKLDKVTFKPVPEAATRSAAIQTGQADIVQDVAATDVETLRQGKGFKIVTVPSIRHMFILLDQAKDPIMKNLKVRQALNYAVDKEALIKSVYQGNATPLPGHSLSAAYIGFNPSLKMVPYDLARAKQLLGEAGYPNGFDMTIWTPRGAYPGDYETAQAVAGQLLNIGVRATVQVKDSGAYITDLRAGKMRPSVVVGLAPLIDGGLMMNYFRTGGTFSLTSMPEFDAMYQKEERETDPEKRQSLLREMGQFQHDQALALWLSELWFFSAVSDRVQGFQLQPTDAFELIGVSVR